jgi:hypothetical protein
MRYEVKMTCDEIYLPEVRSWVQLHPAGFVKVYPPRQVNNVYLDTTELDCLNDHLDGVFERSKLRFRWYGRDPSSARGILELKHKSSLVGWKEYNPIPVSFDLTTICWHDWMQQLRAYAEGNVAVYLASRERPALLNSYVREYYESGDRQVRVTVDYEQAIYEQLGYLSPNLGFRMSVDSYVVIEVKSEVRFSRRVSDVLASFPLQTEPNSKYVRGVMASWGRWSG